MHNFSNLPGDAVHLYSDASHFMPQDYRQELMKVREKNDAETIYFGYFSPDPPGASQGKAG
jgi:hypothetical protein